MKVTLAHGNGGKETTDLIHGVFQKYFSNPILAKQEDSGVFPLSGRIAYSTDSFVVTPIFYHGGDIGRLCVCGTVNDLLMMGAKPQYLSIGFIIEEGMEIADLCLIAKSIAETCQEAGVTIAAADTKVVEGKGGIYINTSGIGIIPEGRVLGADLCQPHDALIVSGYLGDHHACILSHRMGIENTIQSDNMPLNQQVEALFQNGFSIRAMRDVTRGGLGTVVNELAESSQIGCEIIEDAIPVAPQTKAFCSILGLDPLYMGNEGKFVVVLPDEQAEKAVDTLNRFGCHAAKIGNFTNEKGVSIVNRFGGHRNLPVLYGEGLPRIC
ncbi:MAG: hydrogenase expression/formation protein HypE [Oscillospiraceae bacterium]|nr:hydrogenase expression/formation protein HypE [Oscillospiraceae bacterium]